MQLSARELEVMYHVSRGKTNEEVAAELSISKETVKTHVRHVLDKLQARSRAHAVAIIAMNAPEMLR